MDTRPLERFATQSRRDLLAAVDARATSVLATGSVARAERPDVVRKLEAEIAMHGRAHVVDRVAYTWFNRIVALRFMDARDYTDTAIVSPAQGQAYGQPEVLAEAKRGNLDRDAVIDQNTAERIISLLDGSRRSTDAEGEAYALLLTDYCRSWHKSMPFMFEREGDYTELLVPTGLLADGAFLSKARDVLTEEVCEDVEVLGWLYQFYISERKDDVFAGFKKNQKAGADEIPAATQLFTPHWIVRYIVENSLGRLWMLNRPGSRLVDQMEYFIAPIDEETEFLTIAGPEELSVIDPACGSGHMLTYAFDLLYAIYEEEGYAPAEIPGLILTHNIHGTEIDPRAGSLAAFALTMKARAKQRSFLNRPVEPKIRVLEPVKLGPDELRLLATNAGDCYAEQNFWTQFLMADTLGSLIQPDQGLTARLRSHLATLTDNGDMLRADVLERARQVVTQAEYLSRLYAIVVANPPYMGSGNMSALLSEWVKQEYPRAKADLYACFIERATNLARPLGRVGMVTMQSWMFLSSFATMRADLLRSHALESMAHLGTSAFDGIGGAVVSTTAFVLEVAAAPKRTRRGVFVRLVEDAGGRGKSNALRAVASGLDTTRLHVASASTMLGLPGAPIAYSASPAMVRAMTSGTPLGERFQPRTGMNTGDNARFVRDWWEVSRSKAMFDAASTAEAHASGRKWFSYNKGGAYRRWYGNQQSLIAFDSTSYEKLSSQGNHLPSRQHYFLPCVAWTKIATSATSFRYFPQGFVFDGAGVSLFTETDEQRLAVLGFLNSTVAERALGLLSPTLNFQSGDIARLPAPLDVHFGDVIPVVTELIDLAKRDWDSQELSWGFEQSALLAGRHGPAMPLSEHLAAVQDASERVALRQAKLEQANNEAFARQFKLEGEVPTEIELASVSLWGNSAFIFDGLEESARRRVAQQQLIADFISYAVGCVFGRYSLDHPGLILADQSASLRDYLVKVPAPTIRPDADNVIPFVDDGWFEGDIVERFRQFLSAAFGAEHFEENLRFIEESLGVKTLRDYFVTKSGKSKFYDDHVQRYKKRPIYWMFSSRTGAFNALIYMHRYNSSTVSTVLNEYLREYRAKLEVALANAEQAAAAGSIKDQKEGDRLRRVLAELNDYEHDVLYPMAAQQIAIDLDDGVKANYPKLYPALRKIAGLEAAE